MYTLRIIYGLGIAAALAVPAAAQTYTTLYTFPRSSAGDNPVGVTYRNGFLYGATRGGGTSGDGVLFKVKVATGRGNVLHDFAGSDGQEPSFGPIIDGNALYGVTYGAVNETYGAVYKYDLQAKVLTVLHSFDGIDGSTPSGKLLLHDRMLYGVTAYGGTNNTGTIFSVDPATGNETVLYSFASDRKSGQLPTGQLVFYRDSLIGVCAGGRGKGAVNPTTAIFRFRLSNGEFSFLHSFDGLPNGEGVNPGALLLQDGIIYGQTFKGGTSNFGTLFEIFPDTHVLRYLFQFHDKAGGHYPAGGGRLVYDNGVLYGLTFEGGAHGNGVIFSFDLASRAEKAVYDVMPSEAEAVPYLTIGDGVLYGTTYTGGGDDPKHCGKNGCGTVFSLVP
jgi:uncharacterized repeat protein (TIGR03803 family)